MARGVDWLFATQQADGLWEQAHYTGGGFPRVFYLNYHGYPKFFPLWALARYRNLKSGNSPPGRVRPVTILAVTGLTREAEIAGAAGVVAVAGGGDATASPQKLDALHGDITGVISIGLAGALSPHLKVGDVVIADQIISGARNWRCDNALARGAGGAAARRASGPVCRQRCRSWKMPRPKPRFTTRPARWRWIWKARSRPASPPRAACKLAALRVISDDASHVLPPAALVAMKPDGGIALGRVLWSLVEKSAADPGADPHRPGIRTRPSRNYSAAAISVVSDSWCLTGRSDL